MQQSIDSLYSLCIEAKPFTNISIECPIQTVYLVKESFKIRWARFKEGHEYALFLVGHILSKKLAIEVDEVFVDAVLKKVSAHDVIWRTPGYSLDERAEDAGTVFPVHAMNKRRGAFERHGSKGLADCRVIVRVASVISRHALFWFSIFTDCARRQSEARVFSSLFERGGEAQRRCPEQIGLSLICDFPLVPQVVNGTYAEFR